MKPMFAILHWIVYPFFNLVHPCRAIGRNNIPEGGALICPNHTKASDPFFVLFAFTLKHPFRVMAKSQLMAVPIVGPLLASAGIFGVDRDKNDIGALKTAIKVLKDGHKLLLFPEGTRVKRSAGETVEIKTGAAMMAVRCGVPIIPVYIPEKKRWFGRTPVVIGEPYYPQVAGRKGTDEEYKAITAEWFRQVCALEELTK